MVKSITQFFLLVLIFFGLWFSLRQFSFFDDENIKRIGRENEKELGRVFLKSIKLSHRAIESRKINLIIDSLKARICKANQIPGDSIALHIIENPEINAFALPGNNVVVFSGLIKYAENAEELAGVLSHEIGHLQKEHVQKKLLKEIGLTMLFTLAGGDGSQQIITEITKMLSSTSFDREYEQEADRFGVEALAKANIDPEHFGNIMFRLSQNQNMPEVLTWISTHPDTKDRVADIIQEAKKFSVTPELIIRTPWAEVKSLLD